MRHETKPLSEFYKRVAICKACYSQKNRLWKERRRLREDGYDIPLWSPADVTLPVLDPLFLAWLAGFTDGEGCFSIVAHKHRSGNHGLMAVFALAQVAREPLDIVHSRLGIGGVYALSRETDRQRRSFQFRAQGKAAIAIANLLLPYLVVKREVASLLARFPSAGLRNQWMEPVPAVRDEQLRIRDAVQSLNAKTGPARLTLITSPERTYALVRSSHDPTNCH